LLSLFAAGLLVCVFVVVVVCDKKARSLSLPQYL
jgi:hypothetical protein